MKEIKLTQGQVALVDDEDFERLNKFKWFASIDRQSNYRAMRMIKIAGKRTSIMMSREITKCSDEFVVDHKDHNTLNEQRNNLRICTRAQNNQNMKPRKGHSKFKGVYKHSCGNIPWRSAIMLRDIFNRSFMRHLGLFYTEEEAAKVYDEAALKEFGEFAYLNFPEGVSNEC